MSGRNKLDVSSEEAIKSIKLYKRSGIKAQGNVCNFNQASWFLFVFFFELLLLQGPRKKPFFNFLLQFSPKKKESCMMPTMKVGFLYCIVI